MDMDLKKRGPGAQTAHKGKWDSHEPVAFMQPKQEFTTTAGRTIQAH